MSSDTLSSTDEKSFDQPLSSSKPLKTSATKKSRKIATTAPKKAPVLEESTKKPPTKAPKKAPVKAPKKVHIKAPTESPKKASVKKASAKTSAKTPAKTPTETPTKVPSPDQLEEYSEDIQKAYLEALTVEFNSENWEKKMTLIYKEFGICIISDVFSAEESNAAIEETVQAFEKLGTGVQRDDHQTWKTESLPSQVRPGLYQSIFCNLPVVWKARTDKRIRRIFSVLYSDLREKKIRKFVSSVDGINVKPNNLGPYQSPTTKDWAHFDQTSGDPLQCIQGQLVLSQTTACFRASPKSYQIFHQLMDFFGIPPTDKSNWFKIPHDKTSIRYVKKAIEKIGGAYQLPILSNKGSFIVWSSSTIHSARYALGAEKPAAEDPWLGWRCVFYICLRPREEFMKPDGTPTIVLKKREKLINDNRATNHWGTKMFPKVPGGFYGAVKPFSTEIRALQEDPSKVYEQLEISSPWGKKSVRRLGGGIID